MIDDAIHIHHQKAIIMKFISITLDNIKIVDAHSRFDLLELIGKLNERFSQGEIDQYTILKCEDGMPICGRKRFLPSKNVRSFIIKEQQFSKLIDYIEIEEPNHCIV